MNSYISIVFILFFLLFSPALKYGVNAQTSSDAGCPFIRNYTPDEYDADPQNRSVIQDKRGVMYFGNTDGVLEYDGKNWRLIKVANNSAALSLTIDSSGIIYVGAFGEFGYLASDSNGQLKYVSLKNKIRNTDTEKYFNEVWKVFATTHGIYFLTNNKIFRWYDDRINIIPVNLEPNFGFVVYDQLYIVQKNDGLYLVKDNELKLLPYSDRFMMNFGRYVVLPYLKNKLLLATERKGFYIYDIGRLYDKDLISSKEDILSIIVKKFHTPIDKYIRYNTLIAGMKFNNKYAFATKYGGIIIIDKQGKLVQVINKNRGLQCNCVHNIFIDNNYNLWASLDEGISKIEINSPVTKYSEINGLKGNVLSAIQHNGKIYATTTQGLYYLPDYKMSIVDDKHNFSPFSNINYACWNFFPVKNSLLVSGDFGVISIQDTKAIELFDLGKTYCFSQSKKFPNHIFVGLYEGFASMKLWHDYRATLKPGKLRYVNIKKYEDIYDPIWKIISDKNDDLWLSTLFNGLIHLQFTNQEEANYQITRYDTSDGLPQLAHNVVHYINNNLIVATKQGIYKAITDSNLEACRDETGSRLYRFVPDTSFGKMFASDSISVSQIYIDSENKTWINSGNGIGSYTKNNDGTYDWNAIPFKKMPTYIHQFYIDENKIIWICTNEGLFRYDPSIRINIHTQFYTLIRKVTLGKDSIIFYGTNYNDTNYLNNFHTTASLIQPEQLIPTIDYKYNSIIFEYAATCFQNEEATKYKYFLQGYDDRWSNWTGETKKEYTNLSEGTYYFRVKAKNIFGVESSRAVYKFTILSPWYRTIFAYIAYGLIFLFVLYSGIKLANIRLEKIIQLRTIEVQQKTEEILAQSQQLEITNKELEKLSIVASETDNGVMIMDAEGNFEWMNEGLTRLLEYTFEQLINERSRNIIDYSSNPDIKNIINKCREKKKTIIYEALTVTKSGKEIWTQTTLTPIIDDEGNVTKIVAIDTDITKIKNAEQEIKAKGELLAQINKDLEKKNVLITDNITYAKRIQDAILPSEKLIKTYLPDSFLFFKPRDIVSGDFYWFSEQDGKLFIAVIDCTGHGVPGAFMSMIGNTLLNEIVNNKKVYSPAKILEELNTGVVYSLKQGPGQEGSQDDGMDISMCCIDNKSPDSNNEIQIACANQMVYLINNDKIKEIEGDIFSIGGGTLSKKSGQRFTNHSITIEKGTTIYLFTDGYQDQFGGESASGGKGKKFMTQRFKKLLLDIHKLEMQEQLNQISSAYESWKGNLKQVDDILVMGIRV